MTEDIAFRSFDSFYIRIAHQRCFGFDIPCSKTFFRMLHTGFMPEKVTIAKLLQKKETPVHFCVDGWTDAKNIHFIGIYINMCRSNRIIYVTIKVDYYTTWVYKLW